MSKRPKPTSSSSPSTSPSTTSTTSSSSSTTTPPFTSPFALTSFNAPSSSSSSSSTGTATSAFFPMLSQFPSYPSTSGSTEPTTAFPNVFGTSASTQLSESMPSTTSASVTPRSIDEGIMEYFRVQVAQLHVASSSTGQERPSMVAVRSFYVEIFDFFAQEEQPTVVAVSNAVKVQALFFGADAPWPYKLFECWSVFLSTELPSGTLSRQAWNRFFDFTFDVKDDFSNFFPSTGDWPFPFKAFARFACGQLGIDPPADLDTVGMSSAMGPAGSSSRARVSTSASDGFGFGIPGKQRKTSANQSASVRGPVLSRTNSEDDGEEEDWSALGGSMSLFSGGGGQVPAPMSDALFSSVGGKRTFSSSFGSTFTRLPGTPFVGLNNQGATCYLNSLLQSLFMTPDFRNTLYEWDGASSMSKSDKADCIPLQLQQLFAQLQISSATAVSTEPLTRSFGWIDGQAFIQHDVQELLHILFDAAEAEFEEPMYNKLVRDVYEGMFKAFTRCCTCNVESARMQPFIDMSLVIQGLDSMESALHRFLSVMMLEGSNAYSCDTCASKQTAEHGSQIFSLPRVLIVAFKRFEFDPATMQYRKLNHRVHFPFVLDMDGYVGVSFPPVEEVEVEEEEATVEEEEEATVEEEEEATVEEEEEAEEAPAQVEEEEPEPAGDSGSPPPAEPIEFAVPGTAEAAAAAGEDGVIPDPFELLARNLATISAFDPLADKENVSMRVEEPAEEEEDEEPEDANDPEEIDPAQSDSDNLYELFSVLIHSGGGVSSGHYYAYIKSLATGFWYKFNDSCVTRASEAEVRREGFGTNKTDKFGNPTSSANAYMLMYRKLERKEEEQAEEANGAEEEEDDLALEKRLLAKHFAEVPTSLAEDLEAVEAELEKARDPDFLTLIVRCPGAELPEDPSTKKSSGDILFGSFAPEPKTKKLVLHKSTPLVEAEDQAWEAWKNDLEVMGVVERDRVRLRCWNVIRSQPDITYGSDGSKTLEQVGMTRGRQQLVLEVRDSVEVEWETFVPGLIEVKLQVADAATGTFREAVPLKIPRVSTVKQLKQAIYKQLFDGAPFKASALRLFCVKLQFASSSLRAMQSNETAQLFVHGVTENSTIYVDPPSVDENGSPKRSIVYDLFESEKDVLTLKFNIPTEADEENGNKVEYSEKIRIDGNKTLADLKDALSERIGVPASEFGLCQGSDWPLVFASSSRPYELRDMGNKIRAVFGTNAPVHVKLGRPLGQGEHKIEFKLYSCDQTPKTTDLFELVFDESLLVADMKEKLLEPLKERAGVEVSEATHLRIRTVVNGRVTNVVSNLRSVKSLTLAGRDTKLAVQVMDRDVSGDTGYLKVIRVQQWISSAWEMGPQVEFDLDSTTTTMAELAMMIASRFGIEEVDNVAGYSPPTLGSLDYGKLDTLNWKRLAHAEVAADLACDGIWRIMSGSLFLFRDLSQGIKAISEVERQALSGNLDDDGFDPFSVLAGFGSGWASVPSSGGNQALKIKTRRDREREKEEQEREKEEQEQEQEQESNDE